MSSRNVDVNLIIRAKSEADKVVGRLDDALKDLLGTEARVGQTSREMGARLAELARFTADLDRAFASTSAQGDRAAAAFARSADRAGKAVTDLANARERADSIREGLALLQREADKAFVGPRRDGLGATIRGLKSELKGADSDVARLSGELTRLTGRLDGKIVGTGQLQEARSTLNGIGATINAIAAAQTEAARQTDLVTQALRRQEAAAREGAARGVDRSAEVQTAVNRRFAPALVRAPARDSGATFDALAEQLSRLEAEASKVRAAIDPVAVAIGDAEEKIARVQRLARDGFLSSDEAIAREGQLRAALAQTTAELDGSAAAARKAADADRKMEAEAANLRARLDPLASVQERVNEQLRRYQELARAGKITTDELASAERHLAEEAEQARAALARASEQNQRGAKATPGLFGLRPYELQNLSYQINDVVTQLASGTSVTQTLAQQGGQILQIFPRAGGAILGVLKNPAILAAAGGFTTLALSIREVNKEADRLQQVMSSLSFRADGPSYDPKSLVDTVDALEDMGVKSKDAMSAVRALLNEGIAPERLDEFALAARNTAKALGTDIATAASESARAFSAGYDEIARYDDKLGFLTASEREHIRVLFEQGNAEAGRTEALNAYSRNAQKAADQQRGPWAEALRSLGNAWDAMLERIGNLAPIRAAASALEGLAGVVKAVGDAATGLFNGGAGGATSEAARAARIGEVQSQINDLEAQVAQYQARIEQRSPISGTLNALVRQTQRQLETARAELRRLEASAPDTVNNDPNGAAAKRRDERLSEIGLEERLQELRRRGQDGLSRADSQRRAQLAADAAFRKEMQSTGDAIVAGRLREQALAEETRQIDQQNDAARKRSLQEREQQIRQFQQRVVGAEGGTAKNPFSSAAGYGQFTEGTFLSQFRTVFAEQASSLSRDQILALRNNEGVAKAIIDNYTRENARFLERFGAKVTAGNLYLAHFLGPAGARAVLQAPGDTPVDQIIRRVNPQNSGQVLSGNRQYLRTNNGQGRYRTADELEAFIGGRVGDTGQAQSAGQAAITNLLEEARRKQDDFNLSVRQYNEERQRSIDATLAERGLAGQELLNEQRRQAVAEALLDLQQRTQDANRNLKPGQAPVVVSPEQIAETERLTAALFDAEHAQERLKVALDDRERPLATYQEQADLLHQQIEYLRAIGEFDAAGSLESQLGDVNGKIGEAVDNLIAFYEALSPAERVQLGIIDEAQLDNIIVKLRLAREETQEWGRIANISSRDVAQAFASGATQSFTAFIERVGRGRNVFGALTQSVREFAASFIAAVAQMIIQMLALAAAASLLRWLNVPIPAAPIAAGGHHIGGVVGGGGASQRSAMPGWFAGAMRYHTGGIAGLRPNEVPAILEEGEEVLTRGDPRHRANGGTAGGAGASQKQGDVRVFNVFDPAQMLEMALRAPGGDRLFVNHVAENAEAFRAALDN